MLTVLTFFGVGVGGGEVFDPTLYKEAAKIKTVPSKMKADSVFRTRLDRPKLFIEQLIWIEPATFPKL